MKKAPPNLKEEAEAGLIEPELELDDFPLWFIFWDLWNGEGLRYTELKAYMELTGSFLDCDDIDILKSMFAVGVNYSSDIRKQDIAVKKNNRR